MSDKPLTGKEKFIRETISFLTSKDARFYSRSDIVYVDAAVMHGSSLMPLESTQFVAFILGLAKHRENVLLRGADAQLIIDHVRHHAKVTAQPLATDTRSTFVEDDLYINTGWKDGRILLIPQDGVWQELETKERIFEPLPDKMRMPVPVSRDATLFPELLKTGIADFGDKHCLLAVTCATMLLPADFPHPFIVFTGDQARGKSTTMKLLMQLIDPYRSSELMTVGEDMRDIIALVRGRHSIALDNVSKLPFDEDLLSKMYSGGMFSARKMTTNSELSEVELPQLRVFMNGIGTAFSRSDLMSRCIFIEHPVLTSKCPKGREKFKSLSVIERRWKQQLPEALGSLLRAIGAGLVLFRQRGGFEEKTSDVRFVEYAVIGECIAEAMGFKPGLFTEQIGLASDEQKQGAIEADDCAQLILAWLAGERSQVETQLAGWENDGQPAKVAGGSTEQMIAPSELFKEIRELANGRGYSMYSMRWLSSVKALSTAVLRSRKNIENGGWNVEKIPGGEHHRKFKFVKIKDIQNA